MIERFSYDNFVLPYTFGLFFVLGWLLISLVRVVQSLPRADRKKLWRHILSWKILITVKDIFADCLFHVKIWRKNWVLGYMHTSLAFGWFMLIVLGHIEVFFFCPHHLNLPYFPIFFRYFMLEEGNTLGGSLFFFLMDFFLLIVLSGVALAVIKRFRKKLFGMKRTTQLKWNDQIAVFSLWLIFPLRFLAESFTSEISGGGFLTRGFSMIFESFNLFLANETLIRPIWWAYSCCLMVFFLVLPWSRFMHILSEVFLILMRNAGIRERSKNSGYAKVEIYSCSRCGLCIDPCQMISAASLHDNATINFTRNIRWWNYKEARQNASYCLMCDRCVQNCPVGINSVKLKQNVKNLSQDLYAENQYGYLPAASGWVSAVSGLSAQDVDVLYFAGCMTQLTPAIKKSMLKILQASNDKFKFMDEDATVCCGRPLMQAGEEYAAQALIEKNTELIAGFGAKMLVTSCPICYKVFKEAYKLDIPVLHHTEYISTLIDEGRLPLSKGEQKMVFHDSCELGRHSGIYEQPRKILRASGTLIATDYDGKNALCCGGSIATESMPFKKRRLIAKDAMLKMTAGAELSAQPDCLVTACPACKKTFADLNLTEVKDIAEVVAEQMNSIN
ncbi:MAG: (Fe-S)-binding protein [Bacteroidales bacterium]|jgi:Fe-S oxidoreductase|nr:(Fe-S)-binding protein [Bacteroidales bacterium]